MSSISPSISSPPRAGTGVPQAAGGAGSRGGVWRMVLAMLLSGTIGLFVIESGLQVELVVLLRCLIGAVALWLWVRVRREWVSVSRRDMAWLAAGGVALVINWVALFHAYAYAGIGVATVVYHVQPFFLLMASAWSGERIGWRRMPWMLLALAGVVLSSGVVTEHAGAEARHAGMIVWGVLLALLAAALYTLTVIATRRVKHIGAAQTAMMQMAAGGAMLALVLLPLWLQGALALQVQAPLARVVMCVLALGLVHTALMYVLMYGAFQRLGAASIAILSFIYPALALTVDLMWFGIRPGAAQWAGMALIAAAITGYRWGELRGAAKA